MRLKLPKHIDPRHPLVTKEYAVYTPPVDEMLTTLGDWIDQQRTGGYIYGASRFGKSRGLRWHLRSVLEERFGELIPLVMWSRRPDVDSSEAGFWTQLLKASGFQFTARVQTRKKDDLFDAFRFRLTALAKYSGGNYVVLMIDEAQETTFKEWKWLVGLQNALDLDGIHLSIFSVGTHQMSYEHEALASTGNAHVAARFLTPHARFHGIGSVEELSYVLNGYDMDSEWPVGTGKSFLEHFSPGNYERGNRLSQHAQDIWDAFSELNPNKFAKQQELPMQHVAHAIESTLFRLADGTDWSEQTSFDAWLTEIADTGFSDHMRIVFS